MFDIGWTELLMIAAVTIIVVGPKELPNLLRTIGRILGKVKDMSQEFRTHLDDAIKETEIDKLRDDIQDIKNTNFTEDTFDFDALAKDQTQHKEQQEDILSKIEDAAQAAQDHPILQSESTDFSSNTQPEEDVSLKQNRA